MARLFTSGGEMASTDGQDGYLWDSRDVSGTLTVDSTYYRSGLKGTNFYIGSGQRASLSKQFANLNTGTIYARVAFYFIAFHNNATAQHILSLRTSASAIIAQIKITSGGVLQLWSNTAQIGSNSSALSTGQWYVLSLSAAGNGANADARIAGTSFASGSGTDQTNCDAIYVGQTANLTTSDYSFTIDDVAVNDTSGSYETSWPDVNGKIVQVVPNGAGTYAEGSRGGTDSGYDYGQVDESPPNDATDYYVLESNNERFYCVHSSSGIPSSATIKLIAIACRHYPASTSSLPTTTKLGVISSGTEALSSATRSLSSQVWQTNGTALPRLQEPFYINPNGSVAWTQTTVDACEIGVQCVDAAPDTRYSTIWGLIEYVATTAYSLTADAGSYSVSGQTATLARGLKLAANLVEYAIAGQSATMSRGFTMVANAGSYALSVADTAWKRTYAVAADAASYAISGIAATLARGIKLTADAGSYTFTGQAATFSRGFSMVADAASYAVSVAAATSRRTYVVAGDAASYALSVSAATLARGLKLVADTGSYTTTGMAATLAYGRAVVAAAGSFLVSGQDAVVAWGRKLAALLGEYVLTVNDATLTVTAPNTLIAGEASYAVSFSEATLTYSGEAETRRPFWVPSGRPTIKALAANVFRGRPGRAPALGRGGRR